MDKRLENRKLMETMSKSFLNELSITSDDVKDFVYDVKMSIQDLEEKLEFDHGSNATTELLKISKKFISDLEKLEKKYK
tara:strand:- start:10 stop:246 length:237 start_codon:yes stop_codon:yes gene_type:complete